MDSPRLDEWFRRLAELSPDVFWVSTRPQARSLYVSPAIQSVWGVPARGFTFARWVESVHVDDRDRVLRSFGGQSPPERIDELYRIVRADGAVRWIHDCGVPITDEQGQVCALAGIARDVTDSQRLSEQYQRFMELSLDMLAVADVAGRRLLVSPSVRQILGFTPEEYLRGTYRDSLHPDELAAAAAKVEALRAGRPIIDYECRYRCKDGGYRWLQWRASPPTSDGLVYLIGRDVTETKRTADELRQTKADLEIRVAERTAQLSAANEQLRRENTERMAVEVELRQSEARYRALIDAIPDLLLRLDWRGLISECIPPGEAAAAWSPGRLEKQALEALLPAEAAQAWRMHLENARASGQSQIFEQRLTLPDGEQDYEIRLVPSGPDEVLAILRDISDRRRRESQQQLHQAEMAHVARLSMLGEIASGLAHELNQPLSAILSYAQGCMLRLRGPGLPASETVEAIEQIAVQAERAGEILRRIRGFVRRRTPSRSTLQLNEQIENVLALAGHGIREHAVEVIKELDPALPPTLGDRIQLDQVLLNLMWNAVEALSAKPDGRRRLWLRTTRVAEHGVQVTVRDNGPGFASGSETRLFEPFFTTKPQGMGMGLAISRSIIESHGGQLWATANPDGGAAFHFYLPAATRDEPS